jgi:predicted nucleic acid-binding protein
VKHLLDTSALLAFLLNEPEADRVESFIFDPPGETAVSFASRVEIQGRLQALGLSSEQIEAQMADARRLPLATLWPDERTLQAMLQIKTAGYFPFADTLIAATVQAHKLALIHKDPHFDSLPVQQLNLTKS